MPLGSGANRDNLDVRDREILKGPLPDGALGIPPQDSVGQHLFQLTPTKGNLIVGNGSVWALLAVGLTGQLLSVDLAEATGLKWVNSVAIAAVDIDFADGTAFEFADSSVADFAG